MTEPTLNINLFLLFWLTLGGLAIGSFLNVVIYRLPRRESLSFPPSHCPNCQKSIRWFDNIPVLSWLILRGKCRDCQQPISRRYPIIEAVCGIVFFVYGSLSLFMVDLSGEELPVGMMVGHTLFNLVFFCTLLTVGMIEFDRKQVPWILFLPALLVGVLIPIFFDPFPIITLAGLNIGFFFAVVTGTVVKRGLRKDVFFAFVLIGLFLPFWLTFGIGFLTLIVLGITRLLKIDIPPVLFLCITSFVFYVFFVWIIFLT